jgi:hypothetical protein
VLFRSEGDDLLTNTRYRDLHLHAITFDFDSIQYIPNRDVNKKFICAIYNMHNPLDFITDFDQALTNKIKAYTIGLFNLIEYEYIKTVNGWVIHSRPDSILDPKFKGKILIDFTTDIEPPQNVSRIKSFHHSITGGEIIRFYYYTHIKFHISLTKRITEKQIVNGGQIIFDQGLKHLFKVIKKSYHIPQLVIGKDDKFTYL